MDRTYLVLNKKFLLKDYFQIKAIVFCLEIFAVG